MTPVITVVIGQSEWRRRLNCCVV